mgnify:CR=1 FL=1
MTNQEQDIHEAFAIWRFHLGVIADMGPAVDKAEFKAQLHRLMTAADKFTALPRPAQGLTQSKAA